MKININVDELRSIAPLAISAAEKMNETNTIISGIISKHDWKCPERVSVDESLERIKDNSKILNDAFIDFSNNIVEIANDCTDYINDQKRFEAEYSDDISSLLSEMSSWGTNSTVSTGSHISGLVSDMEAVTMHTSNIASLHGVSHNISIVDFSLFTERL